MTNVDAKSFLLKKIQPEEPSRQETAKKRIFMPDSAMNITVDIDLIRPYEKNPRKAKNEKFEEIKESIREIGLQQPFSITVRPDTDHYIIRSGGNTRLQALKELYQETGDERFKKIECNYQSYTNDLDLISLHMMENEQRGRMLFIDIAQATKTFKEMYETEKGESIGLRPLAKAMTERGWSVQFQNLTFYLYATEIADELPQAFNTGLGRKIVSDIRKLESDLKKWAEDKNKDPAKCLQYFKNVLRENDTTAKDLNLQQIESALCMRLAQQLHLTVNDVRNDLTHIQKNGSLFAGSDDDLSDEINDEGSSNHTLIQTSQNTITGAGARPIDTEPTVFEPVSLTTAVPHDPVPVPTHTQTPHSSKKNPKEAEAFRIKNQLNDHFLWIINQIANFDEIFVSTNNEYLFEVKVMPSKFSVSGVKPFFKNDVMGVWHALYFRVYTLKIIIEHKNNPMRARQELLKLVDGSYLSSQDFLPCVISEAFISTTSGILPPDLMATLCVSSIQPEIQEIFRSLPVLDQKFQAYLNVIKH